MLNILMDLRACKNTFHSFFCKMKKLSLSTYLLLALIYDVYLLVNIWACRPICKNETQMENKT